MTYIATTGQIDYRTFLETSSVYGLYDSIASGPRIIKSTLSDLQEASIEYSDLSDDSDSQSTTAVSASKRDEEMILMMDIESELCRPVGACRYNALEVLSQSSGNGRLLGEVENLEDGSSERLELEINRSSQGGSPRRRPLLNLSLVAKDEFKDTSTNQNLVRKNSYQERNLTLKLRLGKSHSCSRSDHLKNQDIDRLHFSPTTKALAKSYCEE